MVWPFQECRFERPRCPDPTWVSSIGPIETCTGECSAEPGVGLGELRRIEALRLAVEVAGWSRSASEPEAVIDIAREFVEFLRGDDEDDGDVARD